MTVLVRDNVGKNTGSTIPFQGHLRGSERQCLPGSGRRGCRLHHCEWFLQGSLQGTAHGIRGGGPEVVELEPGGGGWLGAVDVSHR